MLARAAATLGAVIASTALLMAIASIWLLLADPVTVAQTVGDRGVPALVEALWQATLEALVQVVRWL